MSDEPERTIEGPAYDRHPPRITDYVFTWGRQAQSQVIGRLPGRGR